MTFAGPSHGWMWQDVICAGQEVKKSVSYSAILITRAAIVEETEGEGTS